MLICPSRLAPLERWREPLAAGGREVPHFDPLDGGVDARVLILLGTPGAGMTADRAMSHDNPSGTSRNLRRLCAEVELAREDGVLWNAVPWVVHAPGAANRPLRRGELREGLATLPGLLALLPHLRAVVLLGRSAGEAAPVIAAERPGLSVFAAPHPSPTIVCTHPSVGERIVAALRGAAQLVETGVRPPCARA